MSSLVVAAEATAKAAARVGGPHWSVNGDWNPSVETVQQHLRTAHGIDPSGMGLEEMLAVHDSVHNRMGNHGHSHAKKSKPPAKGYAKF